MGFEGCFEEGASRDGRGVDEGGEPGADFGVQGFVGVHASVSARG